MGCVGSAVPCASLKEDEQIAGCLNAVAKEKDILADAGVASYLQKHKVYISFTTSPLRISKLEPMLKTLDLTHVEKVFAVLPRQYGKTKETYTIPAFFKNYPKLQVLWIEEDLGPITKLLPAVAYVNYNQTNKNAGILFGKENIPSLLPDPNAIVITVDDDTGYAHPLIDSLLAESIRNKAVVAVWARNLDFWGIKRTQWPDPVQYSSVCEASKKTGYCDVVEGFGGIAYPAGLIDVKFMKQLATQTIRECFNSDDLTISYALAKSRVTRIRLNQPAAFVVQFMYGFEQDALHFSAGTANQNNTKYPKCYEYLTENGF